MGGLKCRVLSGSIKFDIRLDTELKGTMAEVYALLSAILVVLSFANAYLSGRQCKW